MSESDWAKVQIGMSMEEVRSVLGEPDDVQTFDMKDPFTGETEHTETWYYGFSYQISFDKDGAVDAKNHY
jgi:outer membrane protein assembly factor BamE (lipoprotein component of BamABCDE complex)